MMGSSTIRGMGQLLKEIAPGVTRIAIIFSPGTAPYAPLFNRVLEAAAPSMGMMVMLAPVHDDASIEEAIAAQALEPVGTLVMLPASFTFAHREVIVAAATSHRLPLIGLPPLVNAGGLMSYWFDPVHMHAQAASYIDRILKGASPADLPVQQPTKYSLIINLKTAKTLHSLFGRTCFNWPTKSSNEAARVQQRSRRGGGMAAYRARTEAGVDAACWAYHLTLFSQVLGRQSRRYGRRRAQHQLVSCSWPIPSGWVLFRVSPGPEPTSPVQLL
jgi:hypothetical protein